MSLQDILQADADSVFLEAGGFGETVTYQPSGGDSSEIIAVIEDIQDITSKETGGFDTDFVPGQASLAKIHVSATDVPTPSYKDTITQGSKVWRVLQIGKRDGIFVLYCSTDQRMRR